MADDLRKLIRNAQILGFAYSGRTGRGHHIFVHSSGKRITTSSTPSDVHSWTNAIKDMERAAGVKIPRNAKKRL